MRTLKYLRTYEVALSKAGLGPVCGVDEAGRGACAGPVTIGAAILPDKPDARLAKLTDSKKLTPLRSAELEPVIKKVALAWSVVDFSAAQVDAWGIHTVNVAGMRAAIAALGVRPGYVLTDAWHIPGLPQPHLPVVGGDAHARCIAAASVLAKVHRDNLMDEIHTQYPQYHFDKHKGYGTKAHTQALQDYGASPEHRRSYANVAAVAAPPQQLAEYQQAVARQWRALPGWGPQPTNIHSHER